MVAVPSALNVSLKLNAAHFTVLPKYGNSSSFFEDLYSPSCFPFASLPLLFSWLPSVPMSLVPCSQGQGDNWQGNPTALSLVHILWVNEARELRVKKGYRPRHSKSFCLDKPKQAVLAFAGQSPSSGDCDQMVDGTAKVSLKH